ncbi:ABC transporter substrate-binding protein [Lysinibacillus sp. FSL L8-0312]|uniref:ABC transporter substrate-binding protein n=1 Tax=unclassified Lysinibacillus TaxID=2636778 RepID=UPI00232FB811|nr:ABC transporter substrate-binding protein [Lysinibacillus sp. OF-1]WCH48015.1 ABC transporter substrate-binding protein [Lysinibacillus sp. OF-1]
MVKARQRIWIGLMMLLLILIVLGGCSKATESPQSESKSNSETDTKIIKTVDGDVEIPANPQRIVTQGYLANFLVFDVKPVGAPYWEMESPYTMELSEGITDIGQIDGGSVEKILSLKPDLIVTVGGDEKLNEQYRKIAPTLVIPYGTYHEVHDEMRAFGEILGKEKEAEKWLKEFDKKVAKAKDSIKGLIREGTTFSLMGPFGKDFYVYGDGVNRGGQAIYQQLGLTPPKLVRKDLIEPKINALSISQEKIADYAGDYIFLDISGEAEFDENDPVWSTIDAVKNNKVFYLNPERFWPYDPIAVESQVEEIAKMLKNHLEQEK